MIRVDDKMWLLWAALLLLLPLRWFLSIILAAFIHELFHIAAVLLLGGKVHQLRLGAFGAVIEATGISGAREAFCAFAGPLGSFLLVLSIQRFPILGLCGLVQGAFNLLPVYPLDGGRALLRLLETFLPNHAGKIAAAVQIFIMSFALGVAGWCAVRYSLGYHMVLFTAFGILSALARKKP